MKGFVVDSEAVRGRLLEGRALVPVGVAVPVNYASLRENVFLLELDDEVKALLGLLSEPETFAEAYKKRSAAREHPRDRSIPFAACRSSAANELYWDITTLIFKPKTMKDMLAIVMPGVTQLLTVSFPDQLPVVVRDPQTLRSAVDNLVPKFIPENLDSLTSAPTLKELSHYVLLDNMLFDVRTIQPFSLAAHSQFYKALQQHYPTLAEKLYAHNYTLTALKTDILTFQEKGKTPRAALEQLKYAFILSGTKMTGSNFASKRAAIGAMEFMSYVENIPPTIKDKLLALKGDKTLKEMIDDIVKGNCVETTGSSIQELLEKNAGNPLLNTIIPTTNLDHLLKRYRHSKIKSDTLATKYEAPETLSLPTPFLKAAINGMSIEHPETLVDLILNFTPDYYELLIANVKIKSPHQVSESITLLIEHNMLSADQYQPLILVIVKRFLDFGLTFEDMLPWLLSIDHVDVIRWVMQHYAEHQEAIVNAITTCDTTGFAPLHIAYKDPKLLRMLLELIPEAKRLDAVKEQSRHFNDTLFYTLNNVRSFQVILELLPANQRLEAVAVKSPKGSVFHRAVKDPEALKAIIELLPEAQRLSAVKAAKHEDNTVLHFAAKNAQSLQLILALYPTEERLKAVHETNNAGYTVLHYAAEDPQSLRLILALYTTEEERLKAVNTTSKGRHSTLHIATRNAESLQMILDVYPVTQQLQAVKAVTNNQASVLHFAARYPESLRILLRLYPDKEERLKAVKATDRDNMTVLSEAVSNPESLRILLEEIPEDERWAAIMAVNQFGDNTLRRAIEYPESMKVILEAIPAARRFNSLTSTNNDDEICVLHQAEIKSPQSLQLIFELLPENQRLAAATLTLGDGESVLSKISAKLPLLQTIFKLIPNSDRLKAVKTLTPNGDWMLDSLVNHPQCLQVMLDLIPEDQRLAAIKLVDQFGNTVLHRAAGMCDAELKFPAFKIILEQVPEKQRLEALMMQNKSGLNVLHHAMMRTTDFLEALFELIPEAKRLEVVKMKDIRLGNTVLHREAGHPERLQAILLKLPDHQRLEAVSILNEQGKSVLQLLFDKLNYPEAIDALQKVYPLLFGEQAAVTLKDALLIFIDRLLAVLNSTREGVNSTTSSSEFFKRIDTREALIFRLRIAWFEIKRETQLENLLTQQSNLSMYIVFFTVDVLSKNDEGKLVQPVLKFLEKFKLPVDAAIMSSLSEHAEAISDNVEVKARKP